MFIKMNKNYFYAVNLRTILMNLARYQELRGPPLKITFYDVFSSSVIFKRACGRESAKSAIATN